MTDSNIPSIYLDANPIAYALEGPEDLAASLKTLFSLVRDGRILAITSELSLAEVLPKGRVPDRQFFELLVWSRVFDLLPVSRDVLIETARYRRAAAVQHPDGRITMPRLPDSIHVVTAVRAGCRYFLSGDMRIKLPNSITFVRVNVDGIKDFIGQLT